MLALLWMKARGTAPSAIKGNGCGQETDFLYASSNAAGLGILDLRDPPRFLNRELDVVPETLSTASPPP